MSELWSPDDYVGYFCQVWAGEGMEHYGIFPLPDDVRTASAVREALDSDLVMLIVVQQRGAMGVKSVVDTWRAPEA